MNPNRQLDGLVVAITGAGQGIGKGLATHFGAAGARVVVADIDRDGAVAARDELISKGVEAIEAVVDVSDAAACEQMVVQSVAAFGRLDLLICNAGVVKVRPFMQLTPGDWESTLAVNVKGTFYCIQAAARRMLDQEPLAAGRPRGKIITMASIAGRYGAGPMAPFQAPYRASKAAVISLTQTAAYSLAPHVTVNAICPGLVATDMWQRMDRDLAALGSGEEGSAFARRVGAVPLGRSQTPGDVAGLALFLASPAADYMTGQSLNIDGGLVMS